MISAKVIADSIYEGGPRLTSYALHYPKFILAEVNTHRVFSRSTSSSRAIPVQKMLEMVKNDPVIPMYWGKNQPGMAADEELSDQETVEGPLMVFRSPRQLAKDVWLAARDSAVGHVETMLRIGLHKQTANRLLEPFVWVDTIVTTTDRSNFFALRNHKMAQPEAKALAEEMIAATRASTPRVLRPGEWHLPYTDLMDFNAAMNAFPSPSPRTVNNSGEPPRPIDRWSNPNPIMPENVAMLLAKVSAARCARVSYLNHEGKRPGIDEDLALYERLMGGMPKHGSPTEHQARVPIVWERDGQEIWDSFPEWEDQPGGELRSDRKSNLYGWVQFRKLIPGENITQYEEFDR